MRTDSAPAEVERQRGARARGADRRAEDEADADVAVVAIEQDVVVAGALHEGPHELGRRAVALDAPADRLAEPSRGALVQVARATDALTGVHAVGGDVREVPPGDHVPAVRPRGARQQPRRAQRRDAAPGALAVDEAQDRARRALERRR